MRAPVAQVKNDRKREHRHRVNAHRMLTCCVCGRRFLPLYFRYEKGRPMCSQTCVERGSA